MSDEKRIITIDTEEARQLHQGAAATVRMEWEAHYKEQIAALQSENAALRKENERLRGVKIIERLTNLELESAALVIAKQETELAEYKARVEAIIDRAREFGSNDLEEPYHFMREVILYAEGTHGPARGPYRPEESE